MVPQPGSSEQLQPIFMHLMLLLTQICVTQEISKPTLLQGFATLLSKLLPHINVTAH